MHLPILNGRSGLHFLLATINTVEIRILQKMSPVPSSRSLIKWFFLTYWWLYHLISLSLECIHFSASWCSKAAMAVDMALVVTSGVGTCLTSQFYILGASFWDTQFRICFFHLPLILETHHSWNKISSCLKYLRWFLLLVLILEILSIISYTW